MVGVAGFEPATPSSRTRCATRLRYTPTGGRSYNGVPQGPQASPRPQGFPGKPMTAQPSTELIEAGGAAVERAARTLAAGGLVAFPTETVYGLGADATNGGAVARVYDAKGRPSFNPLITHVSDLAGARQLARFDATAGKLAAAFWPGPLTLVLPKRADCPVAEL